jgi:hypothetical protein
MTATAHQAAMNATYAMDFCGLFDLSQLFG